MKNRVIRAVCAAVFAGFLASCGAPSAPQDGVGGYADNASQTAVQDASAAWHNPLGEIGRQTRSPQRQTPSDTAQRASAEERLGTQWGDEVDSYVTPVNLQRVSGTPLDEITLRYADKSYAGRAVNSIALAAGKVEMRVQGDGRAPAMVRDGGQYYVRGRDGQAYQLVYRNLSGNTYEIVASVDGLDVISGQSASRKAGGYVLRPYGELVIEGFRKSDRAVASFVFGRPSESYAANTPEGNIRNTGVIGTVVYALRAPHEAVLPQTDAQAFPADAPQHRYARPPR